MDCPRSQPRETYDAVLRVFLHDATSRMQRAATDAIVSFTGGTSEDLPDGIEAIREVSAGEYQEDRRLIADALTKAEGWCLKRINSISMAISPSRLRLGTMVN